MLASKIFKFCSWSGLIEKSGEESFIADYGIEAMKILIKEFGYENDATEIQLAWKTFKRWIVIGKIL